MDDPVTFKLTKLPLKETRFTNQKCYLGKSPLLELCIGQFYKIVHNDQVNICDVSLKPVLASNLIQIDGCVSCRKEPNTDVGTHAQFTLLTKKYPHFVKVKLVVKSVDIALKIKRRLDRTSKYVRDILEPFGIVNGCTVTCTNIPLAEMLHITHIIVESCKLKGNSVAIITEETNVQISTVESLDRFLQLNAYEKRQELGGLRIPYDTLNQAIGIASRPRSVLAKVGVSPQRVLLIGPPGTGKTSLVTSVACDCKAQMISVAGPEVCKPGPGESEEALRDVFSRAASHAKEGPTVLFLDEVDSICGRREDSSKSQTTRLTSQLLTLLDLHKRTNFTVVAATNRPYSLDPAIRGLGRFDKEIYLSIPTREERLDILKILLKDVATSEDVNCKEIANQSVGFTGADLSLLCREATYSKYETQEPVHQDDLLQALRGIRPSGMKGGLGVLDLSPLQWTDIGGMHDVKQRLTQSIEWPIKHPEAFTRLGIRRPRGILLHGPPGCGKTSLVRAAVTASGAPLLAVSPAQVFSPYVGDAEKAVSELFHRARLMAPAVIFLDEIDSLVGARGQGSVQEKVLSTLLNEMDGVGIRLDEVRGRGGAMLEGDRKIDNEDPVERTAVNNNDILVVGATNRMDLLDDALLRPGRLELHLHIPLPDFVTRVSTLQTLLRAMPTAEDLDVKVLAEQTEGFSGADLKNLCQKAGLLALTLDGLDAKKVTKEHFDSALVEFCSHAQDLR